MVESLIKVYKRDLDAVKKELQSYTDEFVIWKIDKNISNCFGYIGVCATASNSNCISWFDF